MPWKRSHCRLDQNAGRAAWGSVHSKAAPYLALGCVPALEYIGVGILIFHLLEPQHGFFLSALLSMMTPD